MVHLNPRAPITLEKNASKYVCSGILSQECENGKCRAKRYQSGTMQNPKCDHDIDDKELLAIIQVFTEWKRYLRGSPKPVRVLTDHKD